jgi:hypothetical protein
MRLNDFSVVIPEGTEIPGGYVELGHGRKFSIRLRNSRGVRCNVQLTVNGKDVGTFRLGPHSNITLERPEHDRGRFTFYKTGTEDAQKAGLGEGDFENGLIRATFTPEMYSYSIGTLYYPERTYYYNSGTADTGDYSPTYTAGAGSRTISCSVPRGGHSEGGVGLSGHSNQKFTSAPYISLDYSQQTTINLRLVCKDNDEPRPLTSRSTPVPPVV